MSDTPRTNAVLDWFYDDMGGKYAVIDKFTELCYELERENAALRAKLDHNANDIDQLVNETTALRTAIERIEQVWIRLPESETDLDYAICDAIDALTKEQP
jgi:hypothetical protein